MPNQVAMWPGRSVLLACAVCAGCSLAESRTGSVSGKAAFVDRGESDSFHGQVVLGPGAQPDSVLLSHIPMLMLGDGMVPDSQRPHAYQLITEARLLPAGVECSHLLEGVNAAVDPSGVELERSDQRATSDAFSRYADDRCQGQARAGCPGPGPLYTLMPQTDQTFAQRTGFRLVEMTQPGFSFCALIYRGQFDFAAEHAMVIAAARVEMVRVFRYRNLGHTEAPLTATPAQGIVFGINGDDNALYFERLIRVRAGGLYELAEVTWHRAGVPLGLGILSRAQAALPSDAPIAVGDTVGFAEDPQQAPAQVLRVIYRETLPLSGIGVPDPQLVQLQP